MGPSHCTRNKTCLYFVSSQKQLWCYWARQLIYAARYILYASNYSLVFLYQKHFSIYPPLSMGHIVSAYCPDHSPLLFFVPPLTATVNVLCRVLWSAHVEGRVSSWVGRVSHPSDAPWSPATSGRSVRVSVEKGKMREKKKGFSLMCINTRLD